MEGEVCGEDELLQKLRDSRRRFQRRMQQLIEKYDQPFEDGPVVQMSTLTYETPQGFRIWGGGLVKERNPGQIQGFPAKADGGDNGHLQVTTRGPELSSPCTRVEDSKSSDVATTFYEEDIIAGSIMPAVPRSPLKDELRRKYLTQVDVLLREEGCLEGAGSGEGRDTCVTPVASLASPTRSAHGNCGVSEESLDGPVQPPSSPQGGSALRPRPASVALVPRSDSISFPGTSGGSFSSSRCSEAEDICNATLSDLYAGMLHSMSRLLGARPCCIISTKTFIGQNWSSRRRHRCKSRMNRTSCRGGGRSRRSPRESRPPASEPGKHTAVLRDCENLLDVSGRKTGLEEGPSFLGVSKPHPRAFAPSWKGLQRTPPKLSSLTYLDSNAVYHLDQENRFMTLRWLISPVKITSRPRILQGQGRNRYREIELKFDKLHQEYCSSPQKQPGLTKLPSSSAVDVYRGRPAPPGGPWGLEACRLSSPLLRAKAKRLSEAFENLGQRSIKAGSCPPKSSAFPPLSKTDPTHSPGRSEHTADLVCRGQDLGRLRSVSPSKAISVPRVQPPGWAKDRYDDIKEKFDKLHQKYCPKSPQRTQVPSSPGAAPGEASVGVQYQKEFLGKFDPDSGSHGPQKPSPSPQWNIKSPLGSIAMEAPPSAGFALATRGRHEVPTKRRRLSEPLEGRRWSIPWDFSPVDRTTLRPGEEVGASQSDWEKKQRKEQHIFQDGREK